MKKAIMISIQPKWCELIASGQKTIEARKSRPKLETPFKCYIYCTSRKIKAITNPNTAHVKIKVPKRAPIKEVAYTYSWFQKVIGEFVCDKVEQFTVGSLRCDDIEKLACLSYREMLDYFYKPNELDGKTVKMGYGWHISDLKIYDTPKELSEFRTLCNKKCSPNCECWDSEYDGCHRYNRITRPPQSWCYVEEVTE